jgi:hypothetical protein
MKAMSLSELMDRTFTLYRNRFWLFCGLMTVPEIAIMLCTLIVVVGFPVRVIPIPGASENPMAILASVQRQIAPVLVSFFTQLFFSAVALGGVTVAVSELYLGRPVTIRGAYRMVQRRVFGLFGLIILLFLIAIVFFFVIFLGVILLGGIAAVGLNFVSPILTGIAIVLLLLAGVVLALWLLMRFAVSIPVYLLERQGVADSMSRSGTLTKGHRGRIFAATIVMFIPVYVVHFAFGLPFVILTLAAATKGVLPLWIQIGQAVSGAIGTTLAGPLLMIMIALIYYDVRIRKEAFDLETMMNALQPAAPAGEIAGAPPPPPPATGF